MRCALFPCLGLGDGLIAMTLAHNLRLAGHLIDIYHPLLPQMEPLFPGFSLKRRGEKIPELSGYDQIVIVYEKLDWMQQVMRVALDRHRGKTRILNPIATPNTDYPFWEEGKFDGRRPFLDNIVAYCRREGFHLYPVKENGLQLPPFVSKRREMKRVIIHPTSSRVGKNWRQEQYMQLANWLEKRGFDPVFILTSDEKKGWPKINAPQFPDLCALTLFVAESGWMIGNDSGIGHLASCVGVPTVTICRSQLAADFWRPAWSDAKVVVPPSWIPNLKGLRWRDRHWQRFVSVKKVARRFMESVEGT